jgi:hypothetical protein
MPKRQIVSKGLEARERPAPLYSADGSSRMLIDSGPLLALFNKSDNGTLAFANGLKSTLQLHLLQLGQCSPKYALCLLGVYTMKQH